MRIERHPNAFERKSSQTVGFVPTLGALHEGHLSLIRTSASHCDQTVVSVFVNPLQFGKGEDFERYPRDEARDVAMAAKAGADVVFAPSLETVYPRPSTLVSVPEVGDLWEGAMRPGHFDGVATVVCKLFNMVRPDVAYFGLKDLQQCAVVKRMVEDLQMALRLSFEPTIRESDGLAMSSRNAYLTAGQRTAAPQIYQTLKSSLHALTINPSSTKSVLLNAAATLEQAGMTVEYFALVDTFTLQPLEVARDPASLIVAARLGSTRLIDNVQMSFE